jgi:hypothetical protein
MRLVHQHNVLQQLRGVAFEAIHDLPASLLMTPQGFHQVLVFSGEVLDNEFLSLLI